LILEAPNDAELREILLNSKTIAVVGVSNKPDRPSYGVAKWLIENSHLDVYLVNPVITELFGRPVYASLADIPTKIDIVDVFRNIADAAQVLEDSKAIHAQTFWLQLGLSDENIYENAKAAGLNIVMNRCSKVEYDRLIKP